MTPDQQLELKEKLAAAGMELLGVDGEKVIIGDTLILKDHTQAYTVTDLKSECSEALKSIQQLDGIVAFRSEKSSKRRRHGKRPKFHHGHH